MTGILWFCLGLLCAVSFPGLLLPFSEELVSTEFIHTAFPFVILLLFVEIAFLYHGYAYHQRKPKRHIGWAAKTAADVIVIGGTVLVQVLMHDRYYFGGISFPFLTTLLQVYWQLYWPTSDLTLRDVSLRGLMQVVIYCVVGLMGNNYKVLSKVVVLSGCVIFYRYRFYSPHVPVVTDTNNGGTVNISTYV